MFLRQVPNVIYSKIAIQTLLLLCIIMSKVVFALNYILGQNKSSVPIVFIFKIIFWIPFWTLSQLCLERDILTPAYLDISTLSHMGWSHQCEVYHYKSNYIRLGIIVQNGKSGWFYTIWGKKGPHQLVHNCAFMHNCYGDRAYMHGHCSTSI